MFAGGDDEVVAEDMDELKDSDGTMSIEEEIIIWCCFIIGLALCLICLILGCKRRLVGGRSYY